MANAWTKLEKYQITGIQTRATILGIPKRWHLQQATVYACFLWIGISSGKSNFEMRNKQSNLFPPSRYEMLELEEALNMHKEMDKSIYDVIKSWQSIEGLQRRDCNTRQRGGNKKKCVEQKLYVH